PDGLRQIAIVYHSLGGMLWSVFMLAFGIYFPERLEFDRKYPWAKWLLMGPLLAFAVSGSIIALGGSENFRAVANLAAVHRKLSKVDGVLLMTGIGLFFTCIGYKQGTTTAPDARRRLRLLLYGSQVALTPAGIF